MEPSDEKLIKYLADHNHWSPFAHTSLQFHISSKRS
jgi:thymidylate synthase (FAD)